MRSSGKASKTPNSSCRKFLQAAQAHKREAERQAGEKAQQILSRAREQAEEIQRGAEAEAGRLADALRGARDARGAEAIDAVKRLLFA